MKFLKHLAISILFALNCAAGWHDSEPFAAWPATNHLRWTANVGTFTNQPDWRYNGQNITNSDGSVTNYGTGYGAWTNNYLGTNAHLYLTTDWDYWSGVMRDLYMYCPFPIEDVSAITNVTLNAKDVRAFDCISALCERYVATGGNVSNFWSVAMPFDEYSWITEYGIFRDEQKIIDSLKKFISHNHGYGEDGIVKSYYYPVPTSAPTNWIAYTASNLCAGANLPTNFFSYTPSRAADGSWTHYGRFYANTYLLVETGIYELVTSAGTEIPYTNSTPSNSVTLYSTNTNIQADHSITEYGWDGLRRAISNLNTTVKTPTWGIGSGTNWSASYSSNFVAGSRVSFTSGVLDALVDPATDAISALSAHPQLEYENDDWGWRLSDTLASGTNIVKTNVASYAHATASWTFGQTIRYLWNLETSYGSAQRAVWRTAEEPDWHYNGTNFVYENDVNSWFDHRRAYSTTWDNYAAPMVHASSLNTVGRTLIMTAKSNSVAFTTYSNYVAAGIASVTTDPVRIVQPYIPDFGVKGWHYDSMNFYQNIFLGYEEGGRQEGYYTLFYGCWSFPSNTLTGVDGRFAGVVTQTTNAPIPTITADKAVEIWDFNYK